MACQSARLSPQAQCVLRTQIGSKPPSQGAFTLPPKDLDHVATARAAYVFEVLALQITYSLDQLEHNNEVFQGVLPERYDNTPHTAVFTFRRQPITSPHQEPESDLGPLWTSEEYKKLFRNYRTEEHYDVTDIEGTIPKDLEGTFYRNGPGILTLGGQQMHCFDGHGLIARVTFENGRASFKSRYIRTKAFEEEMEANAVLYRGYGSVRTGGPIVNALDYKTKAVANTSVLEWGGKLYALWEGSRPFVLDPATLETIGEESFEGALFEGQPFTAHPAWDRHSGRLVAFGNDIEKGQGKLSIWEIDTENKIRKAMTHLVDALPILYLHDFQVTKNWYIFHQAPLSLNLVNALRYRLGACDQTQQIFFDSKLRGNWWLVPRSGGEPQLIETEPLMIWHYGNAYEDESSGKVVLDACTFDNFGFDSFDMREPDTIPQSGVDRFEIDPSTKTSSRTNVLPQSSDFPQLNPLFRGSPDYRYLYLAGATGDTAGFPFRQIIKLNVTNGKRDSWLAPPGCFVGEPIFTPKKGAASRGQYKNGSGPSIAEDDGYVVVLVSDGRKERSSLAIFNASDISAGPICWVNLDKLLPMAFHCAWSPTAYN